MNAQPGNVQAIVARIEALEEQNRRLKRIAASGLLLLTTLWAISVGGQQSRQTAAARNQRVTGQKPPSAASSDAQQDYVCNKDKTTLPASLPASAFPDFNVESLPPNVMVRFDDQFHPEEITFSRIVSKVPILSDKLSLLACMAESLQAEVNDLRAEKASFDYVSKQLLHYAEVLDDHANRINQLVGAAAANSAYTLQLDDFERKLDDFKAAACPVLRRAVKGSRRSWDDVAGTMADQNVQMELDSACGFH